MDLHADVTGRVGALDLSVDLEVAAANCLAVAGPSGAGKTTILRMIAGLTRPRAGRIQCGPGIWFDSETDTDLSPELRRCGYVFQDHALFGHLSAWLNVAYPLRRLSRAQRRTRAHELLDRFGLAARAEARPRELSGGERQRVALARAVALTPQVMLLDEPLSGLDSRTRASSARELRSLLRELGVPSLFITHDFGEAAAFGDELAVLDRGRIVQRGSAAQLAAAPASAFVADFAGAVVLTGSARRGPDGLTAVTLDGGGVVFSTDRHTGPAAATIYPWEISLEPAGATASGSPRNRLVAEVLSITSLGNRVRVGLLAGQPLAAEITQPAARALGLRPGVQVTASWKAAATRVVSSAP